MLPAATLRTQTPQSPSTECPAERGNRGRTRAALRERLVVVVVADVVGVTVNLEAQVWIREQDAGHGRELLARPA